MKEKQQPAERNYNVQIAVGPERREGETLGDYLVRTGEGNAPRVYRQARDGDSMCECGRDYFFHKGLECPETGEGNAPRDKHAITPGSDNERLARAIWGDKWQNKITEAEWSGYEFHGILQSAEDARRIARNGGAQ